jgi:transcriptional regulator with XRE-family HTH domain
MLGVLQQAVSNWEQDRSQPEGPTRVQLVGLLGVTWLSLQTGEDFHIPEYPLSGLALRDGLLACDGSGKNPIMLPPAAGGEGWLVVVGSLERDPLSKEEAIRQVNLAYDQGAAVWVVVDRPKVKEPVYRPRTQKQGPESP